MTRSAPSIAAIDRFFEFCVLGMLACGYLAVLGSRALDAPTATLTGAAILIRALLSAGVLRFAISDRMVTVATLLYIGFYPIDYLFFSREFLTATVHLVFFLAITKILTARTARDYFFVQIIAFLELLAASILSASANFFVFLALFLFFAVATFASAEIRRSAAQGRHVVRSGLRFFSWRLSSLSLGLGLGVLALTAVMFFLLPRTARAAFQHLIGPRYHLPGFSQEVTLGQIGELKKRTDVVMHARVDKSQYMPLKWRGAALAEFDGRRWYNENNIGEPLRVNKGMLQLAANPQRWRSGRRFVYEVHLKETDSSTLFVPGVPEFVSIPAPLVLRTPTGAYRLGYGLTEGLRYAVYSFVEDGPEGYRTASAAPLEPLTPEDRALYLRLPPTDPRVAGLAREMTAGATTPEARAMALEREFHRRYSYTIELPTEEVSDPIAHFLFDRRKGHCEYFSSSMAVMLRSLDIPSRVVTGFQSGVFNPISGWYLIRAMDAHSWVEAWLPGKGWTTFDPTPPDLSPQAATLWSRLQLWMDAGEIFWQDWVLSYDLERQLILANRVEESRRRWNFGWVSDSVLRVRLAASSVFPWIKRDGLVALAVLVVAALFWPVLSAVRAWWRMRIRRVRFARGEASPSDATLLYERLLALLARRGYHKPAWLTPVEFAHVLPADGMGPLVEEATVAYNQLRYGRRAEAAARMLSAIGRLEAEGGR